MHSGVLRRLIAKFNNENSRLDRMALPLWSRRPIRTCLIVNPSAGGGGAINHLEEIRAAFAAGDLACVYTTRSAGDEARVTRSALSRRCQVIVVVGGDGTCSRVAHEILASKGECRLAVVPFGTGNDFSKTLGVESMTFAEIATLVTNQNPSRMDVGCVDGHHFLNSCGFGFDASVLEASNRVRFLKGDAVYIYSALGQLFTYRGIEVSVNGVPGVNRGPMLMVTVSNGRSLGGAFRIAPHASVLDGKLDACFF